MDQIEGFTKIDLEAISDIHYSCSAWISRASGHAGGLIQFDGIYRPGSAGAEDALFIKWKINEFCEIQEPFRIHGLVVDFRNLDYEWGDDLDVPARRLRSAGKPILIVVSRGAQDVFASCLGERDLRTEIDQAIREVDADLSVMKL